MNKLQYYQQEFNRKYIDLVNQGYTDDSPEMIQFFQHRSKVLGDLMREQTTKAQKTSQKTAQQTREKDYFETKFHELISAGYSVNSPEVINLFREKAAYEARNRTQSNQTQNRPQQTKKQSQRQSSNATSNIHKSSPQSSEYKPHIVIGNFGRHYLLDKHLHVIDTADSYPVIGYLARAHNLRKFKRQLKRDLKSYKQHCRAMHQSPDQKFIKMHKDIRFYLELCPDADYCILELLRKHITKLDSNYSNYQTACAEYLRELAKYSDGDPDLLPFDINYATLDNYTCKNHRFIANTFVSFSDPVDDFRQICKAAPDKREEFLTSHRETEPKTNLVHKYSNQRNIRTSRNYESR